DLAGVVVLGPQTVMINAKELPKSLGAGTTGQRNMRVGELGNVLTAPLTSQPRIAETTFSVWYGKEEAPDVHTVTLASFIDRQILLEVTVAELDRTKIESWGIDLRIERSAFLMSFFNGGGVGPAPLQSPTLVPPLSGASALPLGTTTNAPIFGFTAPKE